MIVCISSSNNNFAKSIPIFIAFASRVHRQEVIVNFISAILSAGHSEENKISRRFFGVRSYCTGSSYNNLYSTRIVKRMGVADGKMGTWIWRYLWKSKSWKTKKAKVMAIRDNASHLVCFSTDSTPPHTAKQSNELYIFEKATVATRMQIVRVPVLYVLRKLLLFGVRKMKFINYTSS